MKKTGETLVVLGLLALSSCGTDQSTESGVVKSPNEIETNRAQDIDESQVADYSERRRKVMENINTQILNNRSERDSLLQNREALSEREQEGIDERLKVLEIQKDKLQEQQAQIRQGGMAELEFAERDFDNILLDRVETNETDRSVRGEGTSLDGPDINRTGTRTGTEIEKRQQNIDEDMDQ